MLSDAYARKFSYLRLSLTEICNFKCAYCLPNGYQKPKGDSAPELSLLEVQNLLMGIAHAGFSKVRFTGGEPTVRPDLLSIIGFAGSLPEFKKIALTTNGWNLTKITRGLKAAGLTHLNVSVDSLDRTQFHRLTGRDQLTTVMEGIDQSLALGYQSIKINAVLHLETAEAEISNFMDYVKTRPVSVRFIELMKTKEQANYRERNFISAGALQLKLHREGWTPRIRSSNDGPALEYAHADSAGSIGFIAPHSDGFCESCNRLRINSRGALKLCLFGNEDFSLRAFLGSKEASLGLKEKIGELLAVKPISHFLAMGEVGNLTQFSAIGG